MTPIVRLNFRWTANEEAKPNKRHVQELLDNDWLMSADFLKDVIFEATELYNEVLTRKHIPK